MKLFLTTILIFVGCFASAQSSETENVKTAINNFFAGMRNADSLMIKNSLATNVIFQTISATNEVKNQKVSTFVNSVSKAAKGSLDERITFANINIDGNLASVWTPYDFYLNGTFSHCGVNSFQLHKENKEWKIIYIIDTRRKENCVK